MPKIQRLARYLGHDLKLPVKEIAFLLDRSERTVERWRIKDKWGDGVQDFSLDATRKKVQANLALSQDFLLERAKRGEFNELWVSMMSASKRAADLNASLIVDAPFDAAKTALEGLSWAQTRLDQKVMPEDEKALVKKYLEELYVETLEEAEGDN